MMRNQTLPSTRDFQFIGGSLALDFINTVGNRLGASRDYFDSQTDVERWARLVKLIGERERIYISGARWRNLLRTREDLYELFRPVSAGNPIKKPALGKLNQLLREVAPYRQLALRKPSVKWVWETPPGDPVQVLAPILFDAAELLASGNFRKIRQCAGRTCGWLFLDRSQAGNRKWCSMTDCGNRNKVRTYYRRKHFGETEA